MQALGPHDINRAAGPVRHNRGKQRAEGSNLTMLGLNARETDDILIYTSTTRERPLFSYTQAAIAQIDIDFPMFYKAE